METKRTDWRRPMHEVVMMLALRNARSAAQGRPCPVAASVVARIESRLSYENHMNGVSK